MRKIKPINDNWKFIKADVGFEAAAYTQGEMVNLPHTWNAKDGQDGGNDYYRGRCWYVKSLDLDKPKDGIQVYLEFCGANSSADVYLNGQHLSHHDGGYSLFRVNITGVIAEKNILVVAVDNSPNRKVYPQKADFTFYGGIYRDVNIIIVPDAHFDLDYFGSTGIQVTTEIQSVDAVVTLKAWTKGGQCVRFEIEGVGSAEANIEGNSATALITIPNVRLWNGLKDPYLYKVSAGLIDNGMPADEVSAYFGCRSFHIDKDKGFFLNGKSYPLRGVAKHQDFYGVGNAVTREIIKGDIELIKEIGANTIRLAHYQCDQYVYDLCDKSGIVLWTEIPYITEHMESGNDNTCSQLTELIVQNYNHPSIVCWGLSNEITAVGGSSNAIETNHKVLNNLAHRLDKTRPTAMANAFMLEVDSPILNIPDIISYNLYFGWYVGDTKGNDEWFDDFRTKNPDKIIGLSEYGADANPQYHSTNPERSDYTEEYQAIYHEHMLELFERSPYMWATYVWNMFDFGADGRSEGGNNGRNQKGLVTFDRKLKKDAFYLYKSYWSSEPFVHICGRRYVDRTEAVTHVKVYSNQQKIALYCDGKFVAEQNGQYIFKFDVPISGKHTLEAKSGPLTDTIRICKVEKANPDYILAGGSVANWFKEGELQFPEGFYSINDTLGDIKRSIDGAALIQRLMDELTGEMAKGIKMTEAMVKAIDAMKVETIIKQAGGTLQPQKILRINQALNCIKKVEE